MKTKHIITTTTAVIATLLFLSGCGKKPEELAQIAQQSDKKEESLKAVSKLETPGLLYNVAISGKDGEVRLAAVNKLQDAQLLQNAVRLSRDSAVAVAAVQKINDQGILAAIARNDDNGSVRLVAVEKLNKQEALVELAKRAPDGAVRLAAMKRLTEKDDIVSLAKFSGDAAVRRVAAGKIDDQEVLADIAKRDDNEIVRDVAVGRLNDQRLLTDVVKSTRHWETGVKAIGKIRDQQALLGFVKTARNAEIRRAVIGQIKDQKVLADIAKNDDSEDVSVAAVKRLSDQPTLVDVAQFGRNEWARLWAVSRISDQGILEKFARNHKDAKMRAIALREISSEDIIVGIAQNDQALIPVALYKLKDQQRMSALVKNWLLKPSALEWGAWKWLSGEEDLESLAIGKFTVEETFADIAKTGSDDGASFREKCLVRVREQKLLADIVKNADSRKIRKSAFERLTDEQLLADVAKNAKYLPDADRALAKLKEMPLVSQETLAEVAKFRTVRSEAEVAPLREIAKNAAKDIGLEMIAVPAGSFSRGDERGATYVGKPFLLGKTEVTQAQWEAVMGNNPSSFKGADRPVERVSWDDAMAFCKKLTERERAAGRLPDGYEYTLPTEAQWEYACRAGTRGDYGGTGKLDDMGWYYGSSGRQTRPVAQKQANAWGFYDMHGNVREWCLDKSGDNRIFRGGSWSYDADGCRSSYRDYDRPDSRYGSLGVRLALSSVRGNEQ